MIGNQILATKLLLGIVFLLLQLSTIHGFAKLPVISSSLRTPSSLHMSLPGGSDPSSKRFYGLSQPVKHTSPTKNPTSLSFPFPFPLPLPTLPSVLTTPAQRQVISRELLAGLVVALATIPTSVAYSSIIGLSPMVGIWSSAITGLVVSLVGGGPGMIAGAAGELLVSPSYILHSLQSFHSQFSHFVPFIFPPPLF